MQSKKYQLLIIEDDRTLAEGLQRALTMDDRQVHLCENLRKAKEYLQKETVDLILLVWIFWKMCVKHPMFR